MTGSRVKKYKKLRDSIKEGANIERNDAKDHSLDEEDDQFFQQVERWTSILDFTEDTLTEAKTFEQIAKEGNMDIDHAIQLAKDTVGKAQYNTRLDILKKIRHGEDDNIDRENALEPEVIVAQEETNSGQVDNVKTEPKGLHIDKKDVALLRQLALLKAKEEEQKHVIKADPSSNAKNITPYDVNKTPEPESIPETRQQKNKERNLETRDWGSLVLNAIIIVLMIIVVIVAFFTIRQIL